MMEAAIVARLPKGAVDDGRQPRAVPHFAPGNAPLVRVYDAGDSQRLEHLVTGEIVALQALDGSKVWTLHHDDDGWGFLKADGVEPVWITTLLKTALISCQAGLYVQRTESGRSVVEWLRDVQHRHEVKSMSWPGTSSYDNMPRLDYVIFESPRHMIKSYFNLLDLQKAAGFQTPFARSGDWCKKMRPAWESTLKQFCLPPSHLMKPCTMNSAEDIMVSAWHASPAAVIAILLQGAMSMKATDDKEQCRRLLLGFLAKACGPTSFYVNSADDTYGFHQMPHEGIQIYVSQDIPGSLSPH